MIVRDPTLWAELVEDRPPYWQPGWAALTGKPVGLLVGDGVAGPVVCTPAPAGGVHLASPPGDVGIADFDPRPVVKPDVVPRPRPKPGLPPLRQLAHEAMREVGAVTAFVKTDPHWPVGHVTKASLARWESVPLAGTVFVDAAGFDRDSVSKNVRRSVTRCLEAGYRIDVLEGADARPLLAAFAAAHADTMAAVGATARHRLTVEQLQTVFAAPWWQATLVVVRSPAGDFAAGDIVLRCGTFAANPWGVTAAEHRGPLAPAVTSAVAAIEAARDAGALELNIGGGLESGDGLEAYKLRYSPCRLEPQHGVRMVLDADAFARSCEMAGVDEEREWFPPWMEEAA